MRKFLACLFVLGALLFTFNEVMACTGNCKCGCKSGKQCTCFKDKKGNVFKTDIINLNANERKAEAAQCNCSDKKCSKKCKCSRTENCTCGNECKCKKECAKKCECCGNEKCTCKDDCSCKTKCKKSNGCKVEDLQKNGEKKKSRFFKKSKKNCNCEE